MASIKPWWIEFRVEGLLAGSWVSISGVVSPPIWVSISTATRLMTPLRTTHEPPSRDFCGEEDVAFPCHNAS